MESKLILLFLGSSILLTLMPGPDILFVLTESLTRGHKSGITTSIGLVSGTLIHTLAAATGLSIIIQKSAITFQSIKILGTIYLFYLAFKATKEKKIAIDLKENSLNSNFSKWKYIRKGFLMNVLNPKVSLFFIAFLPQFITKNGFHITIQMILLGIIFMIQALVIFSLVSVLSGKFSTYLNNSKFWKITKWLKVTVLSILGITLAISEK